jgi:hypothetical protein
MEIHCAQCGSTLTPANVHRCPRCGLPYCGKHARRHECEPSSRESLAGWAKSFEPGAEHHDRAELPSGATYHAVSGASLFTPDLFGNLILWLTGIGLIIVGVLEAVPLLLPYVDLVLVSGIGIAVFGSVLLARTFSQMHRLPLFVSFLFALVFMAIPILLMAFLL